MYKYQAFLMGKQFIYKVFIPNWYGLALQGLL